MYDRYIVLINSKCIASDLIHVTAEVKIMGQGLSCAKDSLFPQYRFFLAYYIKEKERKKR
jgi:hypothetical protein